MPDQVLIPGVRAIEALLSRAPHRLRRLYHHGPERGARQRLLERARLQRIPVDAVSAKHLDDLVPDIRHQGVVADATPAGYVPWPDLLARPDALLIAADEITDPRNLGAILRAGEAMGATGALLTRHRCARLGPAVTRASAGASELLPVALETNLATALRLAADAGVRIIGADLDGQPPDTLDWTGPTIMVLGSEGRGLRRLTRRACHATATIPLTGATESLNVAAAAAVLLYEATRQRRPSEPPAARSSRP